jgi:four helix bundle protein
MYQSFEELEVWKRACQLSVQVFDVLRDCGEFGLRNQMQRAAVSIASNIAEGAERGGKDFIRFITIARGSAAELRTQCYIACKIGILTIEQISPLITELKEISKMLTGRASSYRKLHDKRNKLNTEH